MQEGKEKGEKGKVEEDVVVEKEIIEEAKAVEAEIEGVGEVTVETVPGDNKTVQMTTLTLDSHTGGADPTAESTIIKVTFITAPTQTMAPTLTLALALTPILALILVSRPWKLT